DELLPKIAANHGAFLIAERHGVPVGLVNGYVVDEPSPIEERSSTLFAYVCDIFIRPEQRGSGLAELLIDELARHFAKLPLPLSPLRLNVLALNRMACRAYEKAGFKPYEIMYERPLRS